jgi:hypothetical protein
VDTIRPTYGFEDVSLAPGTDTVEPADVDRFFHDFHRHLRAQGVKAGMVRVRALEEQSCLDEESLAEQRATDLEHQLVVVIEAKCDDAVEPLQRTFDLPQRELRLAEAGQGILVFRIHHQRDIKRLTRPRVFLARELGVPDANMEIDRLGVPEEPFAEERERLVVTCFVVQLVGLLIILVGAEIGLRHVR